jgi:predicted NAD-dependent protein-ADP-ribosyltransferase YbiA (DUF1768 family)
MIGTIAKLAVSRPKKAAKAGFSAKKKVRQDIFYTILRDKYRADGPLRHQLLLTGGSYLIELCEFAKSQESDENNARRNRWAGMAEPVDANNSLKGHRIFGDNRMGLCLMKIREYVRAEKGAYG